uniref:Uncharacterized protein n=1 Tax=Lepeophtheirus salmonis TaxID=72036 RepID=A0A0K2TNZ6_LEPSM
MKGVEMRRTYFPQNRTRQKKMQTPDENQKRLKTWMSCVDYREGIDNNLSHDFQNSLFDF